MRLTSCLHQYFTQYLPWIKGTSKQSVKAYRQTFSLLLHFLATHHSVKIKSLKIEHLSADSVLAFLHHLEVHRKNVVQTRNNRLSVIKSLAKMIRFMHPDKKRIAEVILNIPQKKAQKKIMGFLYPKEVMKVFEAVDFKKNEGMRDYTILHLLYDSGARASEIATLGLDYFDPVNETIAVLGKGNQYRLINLWPITASLITNYILNCRIDPIPLFGHRLFINQRKRELTRHGINKICRKYLAKALPPKRLKGLSPAHCFRHSCAVKMRISGDPVSDIKNRLGHKSVESTMTYLHIDLSRKRDIQKRLIEYTQSKITHDKKIDELIDWKNDKETLTWLDSL
ncbi:MAG: tyrosine-type recombinase/integrase [Desulfobacteraceae bacterium]|jgi:integrase/recombinase XerD|nr:tyrosine-type recombinase/integrase [Desulfobacteraceae bacterium]